MANESEIVDIVDQDGNVLYQIKKIEAHRQGLLHKTVIAGVRTSNGKIMVVEQASDRQEPGQLVNPIGGHVAAGETDEEALMREAAEEMGFKNFKYKQVGKEIFDRKILGRHENHYFILYEITTDEEPLLGPEAVGFKLFTKEEYSEALKNTPEIFGASHHFVLKTFYPELFE